MKFFSTYLLLFVASLPALIAANNLHDARHIHHRQAPPPAPAPASSAAAPPPAAQLAASSASPTSSAPPGTSSSAAPGTSGAPSSGVVPPSGSTTTPTTTFTFSLLATNPTAIPLTDIVSGASSQPTRPLDHTFSPGSQPTYLAGAPPLPNAALLSPASYPALDKPPPTDSPEVQQWIQDVQNSGVIIPNIAPTVLGGCPANAAAAADTSRCWWTCGGCTRSSDITTCPDKMTWGLTYDDGPSFYTSNLMQYLDSVNLKTTFFVVGSRVISFPLTLQDQYMSQHQIAVHTWSHPSLTTLSNEEIIAELGWSKKVIKDVLGVTPNIMRPPFGDIDDRVRAISIAMGLTPVIWTRISPSATFDTGDFNINGGLITVGQVLQNWENILGNATQLNTGFIVLEHDLFQQTVDVATGYILPDALAHNNPPFSIKPVVSCLNMPLTDAYIELNDNKTNPPAISAAVSGGAVTLSSGAPGSAQATGSKGSSNSALSLSLSVGLELTVLSTVGGLIVGIAAVLF